MERPFHGHKNEGLQIIFKRIPGVTKRGVLSKPFHFQIGPLDEFGTDHAGNWSDYTTVNGGTFTRQGSRGLDTIQFRSMVVDYNPTWAVKAGGRHHRPGLVGVRYLPGGRTRRVIHREIGHNKPHVVNEMKWLKRLEAELTPFLLIAWNKGLYDRPEVRMAVTLRSLAVREQAGEPDARYFDMSFTEWRRPKLTRQGYSGDPRRKDLPARIRVNKDGVAFEVVEVGSDYGGVEVDGQGRPVNLRSGKRVAGKPGNPVTLRDLSKVYYGTQSYWKNIAAKNGLKKVGGAAKLAGEDSPKQIKNRRKNRGGWLYLVIPRVQENPKFLNGRSPAIVGSGLNDSTGSLGTGILGGSLD